MCWLPVEIPSERDAGEVGWTFCAIKSFYVQIMGSGTAFTQIQIFCKCFWLWKICLLSFNICIIICLFFFKAIFKKSLYLIFTLLSLSNLCFVCSVFKEITAVSFVVVVATYWKLHLFTASHKKFPLWFTGLNKSNRNDTLGQKTDPHPDWIFEVMRDNYLPRTDSHVYSFLSALS